MKKRFTIHPASEALDYKEPELVSVKEDHFVFAGTTYRICIEYVTSYAEIVAWVYHLSDKNWVTNDTIRQFIGVACKQNGLRIYA